MNILLVIAWVGLNLALLVDGDCYLSSPRGSNNRLKEKSANRRNGNRVFDSQNNNRGGYNVGDKTDKAATDQSGQNPLEYFMSGSDLKASTFLPIEWVNQHGCGAYEDGTEKLNCNIVIQYMCQKYVKRAKLDVTDMRDGFDLKRNDYKAPPKPVKTPFGTEWKKVDFKLQPQNPKLKPYNLKLKQIAVGDGKVMGVSKENKIYYGTPDKSKPSGTAIKQLIGSLKQISVGDGKIMGVSSGGKVLFRTGVDKSNPYGKGWIAINNSTNRNAIDTSVGDGKIMGIDNRHEIYFRTGVNTANPYGKEWRKIPGRLQQISVGDGKIMGVNRGHRVYFRTGVSKTNLHGTGWREVGGRLKQISVGDGKIIGVNRAHNIYYRHGVDDSHPYGRSWKRLNGRLAQISVGDGKIMGVSRANDIYFRTGIVDVLGNNRETYDEFVKRRNGQSSIKKVLQDPYEWYDKCQERKRNKDLFTADQKLKGHTSKYTRQNPQGTRRGYECPEERDYYPYWHPTPWKDAFILAGKGDGSDTDCEDLKKKSFNTNSKFECVERWKNEKSTDKMKHYSRHNTNETCTKAGGEWLKFHNYLEINEKAKTKVVCETPSTNNQIWARPMFSREEKCLVKLAAPECKKSPFSRVNHLGNANGTLEPFHVMWRIPHFPSEDVQTCVVRIRYNISTNDYDPKTQVHTPVEKSPIKQNPTVHPYSLKLAINTAQFGRTFQDRSHIFRLVPRSSRIAVGEDYHNRVIHTVSVRGKRGNIVQTFPAVEYDYIPTNLVIKKKDLVHFTWTGSNTHNNGNPGGDGQTGDAGQGTRGTDRHNVCGLGDRNTNFLLPHDNEKSLCYNIEIVVWSHYGGWNTTKKAYSAVDGETVKVDACIQLMSGGYYGCLKSRVGCTTESLEKKTPTMNTLLNDAHASFHGILLQFKVGKYNYVCSRNNNFTNRSQKATLVVKA